MGPGFAPRAAALGGNGTLAVLLRRSAIYALDGGRALPPVRTGDVIDGVGPILEIGGHAVGRRRGLAVAATTPQGRDVLALRDKSGLRAVLGDRALALAAGRLAVLAPLAGAPARAVVLETSVRRSVRR